MIFVDPNAAQLARFWGDAPTRPVFVAAGQSDGRVFRAAPFTEAEAHRTAPTLRAPTARRKAPR